MFRASVFEVVLSSHGSGISLKAWRGTLMPCFLVSAFRVASELSAVREPVVGAVLVRWLRASVCMRMAA